MANFENNLQTTSHTILKRELTESERVEFLELAAAIGVSSVNDYLYMLMIFKRNEDSIAGQLLSFKKEMKARFDEMGVLEKKIDATLGTTLEDMFGKGAEKALVRISEAVYQKSDDLAVQKNRGFMLRSWGFAHSMTLLLCVIALNAGYVMGSGKDPFWLRPGNSVETILSWFFNVPSGWLVAIGSAPLFVEILRESVEKLRLGIEKDYPLLLIKATAATVALVFLLFVVLGF